MFKYLIVRDPTGLWSVSLLLPQETLKGEPMIQICQFHLAGTLEFSHNRIPNSKSCMNKLRSPSPNTNLLTSLHSKNWSIFFLTASCFLASAQSTRGLVLLRVFAEGLWPSGNPNKQWLPAYSCSCLLTLSRTILGQWDRTYLCKCFLQHSWNGVCFWM